MTDCYKFNFDKMNPEQRASLVKWLEAKIASGVVEKVKKGKATPRRSKALTEAHRALFEQFWQAFGYKKGKKEALQAWALIPDLDDQFSKIMYAAKKEAYDRGALLAKGSSPKWAQGWLTAERWADYDEPPENLIKHKKDSPPEGWEAYFEEVTGNPPNLSWWDLSVDSKAEIIKELNNH